MKLIELLCESIDLVHLRPAIQAILRSVLYQIYTNISDKSITSVLSTNKPIVKSKLISELSKFVADKLKFNCRITILPLHSNVSAMVTDSNELIINQIHLDNLFNTLRELQGKASDEMKLMFNNITKDFIVSLINDLIHELVHVAQRSAQQSKKQFDLKRSSYLEPDSEKYELAVKRFTDTPGNYVGKENDERIYKSSPDEITAFAHSIVLKIIDDYNLDDPDNITKFELKMRENIVKYLKRHKEMFLQTDKTHTSEQVFRRYAKLIYTELYKHIKEIKHG